MGCARRRGWMAAGAACFVPPSTATPKLAIRNPKTRNSQLKNSQFSIACGDNS